MKKIVLISISIILVLILTSFVYANIEIPEDIRIGLYYGSTSKDEVVITSTSSMIIGTSKNDSFYENEELSEKLTKSAVIKFSVDKEKTDYVRIYIDDILVGGSNSPIGVKSNGSKLKLNNSKSYRGIMEISIDSTGRLKVINELPLQEYLYSVVPSEIESYSHIEALKAQAVAARTFTLTGVHRHESDGFNLCATTHCQVYAGTTEATSTTKAVDETKNVIMTYNNQLVQAYYFSTSGGYTEDVLNVWTADLPYLKSVKDIYEVQTKPWVVEYTKSELEEILNDRDIDIGEIINLKVTEYLPSGRANKIVFVGTKGTKEYTKEYTRTLFNLKSRMYTLEGGNNEISTANIDIIDLNGNTITKDVLNNKLLTVDGKEINSNTKIITADGEKDIQVNTSSSNSDTYIFTGYGSGHGVGMSQNGAKGMADAGFTYDEILKYYYTGITIQK